ncbi:unnamed protein product [Calicophoron daubneyi]|uniref:Retrotransposon gag domain-containing protein n=1 Tax=Calicophoron daubneyi TaxID=300641 RepID=A0AAV2TMK1_CALDB
MSEPGPPPKSESSTRSTAVYAHPIAVATTPRLLPRQPDIFVPGDDFDLWQSLMQIYLKDVPQRDHLQYIVSFLNKEAAKQFLACKLPHDAAPNEVWGTLRTLFSFHTLPAASMDQLYERRQKPGESVRAYAGALRQLAVLAFPDSTAEDLDQQILRRFITGVSDPNTRSKFLRKPPTSLEVAIQKALDFEAITQLQRPLEANLTISSPRQWQQTGPPTPSNRTRPRWQRGSARARCPYCQRFGSRARACGHNQTRPIQSTGRYVVNELSSDQPNGKEDPKVEESERLADTEDNNPF